jgi:hypothetical protein
MAGLMEFTVAQPDEPDRLALDSPKFQGATHGNDEACHVPDRRDRRDRRR